MDDICMWRVALDQDFTPDPESLLADDEQERAARIVDRSQRSAWVRSRAALRVIVARYEAGDVSAVRFEYGPYGKPRIAGRGRHGPPLYFSLARSKTVCIIAVARKRPVGVDIEQVSGRIDFARVAAQFLAEDEIDAIRLLPNGERVRAFFEAWTRKEAFAKAIGVGLQLPLPSVTVSAGAGHAPIVIATAHDNAAAWRLVPFSPAKGYVGSLAVRDALARRPSTITTRILTSDADEESWPLCGDPDP